MNRITITALNQQLKSNMWSTHLYLVACRYKAIILPWCRLNISSNNAVDMIYSNSITALNQQLKIHVWHILLNLGLDFNCSDLAFGEAL